MWKPSSNTPVKSMTSSSTTDKWHPSTFRQPFDQPETQTTRKDLDEGPAAQSQASSSSFNWTPQKSGPASSSAVSQVNTLSSKPVSVKSISKQWPPPRVPENDETEPIKSDSVSTTPGDAVQSTKKTTTNNHDADAEREKIQTKPITQDTVSSNSRGSSMIKEIENSLTDVSLCYWLLRGVIILQN